MKQEEEDEAKEEEVIVLQNEWIIVPSLTTNIDVHSCLFLCLL